MARTCTPTYTIEFPLHIPAWQKHRLEKKLKIARTVYNSCLGEALKRHKNVKANKEYRTLLKEPKSNNTGLRYVDFHILWGDKPTKKHPNPKNWLCMSISPKANDEYAHLALMDKTKYVRIMKRVVRGKERYFVQLIQEGYPPTKRNRIVANDENKRVGIDIGSSTIAISSEKIV